MEATAIEGPPSLDIKRFFLTFLKGRGAIPALAVSTLLSFSIGCTVGVVPEVLSDRYARLYHQYEGESCSNFEQDQMPEACRNGADNAQEASAWATLLLNILTLFCSPVVGSVSDVHGRRGMLIFSTFLSIWSPIVLVIMQVMPSLDPLWFYIANSLIGVVNYNSIIFAALSDSMPEEFRAPSFALIMAGFYSGFALSPSLALLMSHFQVSVLSSVLVALSFLFAIAFFPETLPASVAAINREARSESNNTQEDRGWMRAASATVSRPFRELSILNRGLAMRLVAVGSFFSSMVYSTDSNLVVFYIEDHLNVREKDIAKMFFVMCILGIIFQAFLLQPLVKCLGEKGLLVTSFLSGTFHNFLYGAARSKGTIYVALCFSQLTKTNFPILSSFASKSVSVNEQGQVQGALFALNALSAAVGPLSMQKIYDGTKDNFGPGTMFFFASFLYFVGTVVVSFIPIKPETPSADEVDADESNCDLEEPLLRHTISSIVTD